MKLQLQKQKFEQYFETTVSSMKEKLFDIQEDDEIDIQNHPEVKALLKELVDTIYQFRANDIQFYNELLKELPQIAFFKDNLDDINNLKNIISDCVISGDTDVNSKRCAHLMKSSKIFYFINKNVKELTEEQLEELGDLGIIRDYLKSIWKQAKQEDLLGIVLYINSGQAAKDYIDCPAKNNEELKEKFLYERFRSAFKDLKVYRENETDAPIVEISTKEQRSGVSAAKYLDFGAVIDDANKKVYMGFATSDFDTAKQNKQYFQKLSIFKEVTESSDHRLSGYQIVPIMFCNSLINENELEPGQREHKKAFLDSFADKLTKEDKNKINCSGLLAIAGNIKMNDMVKGLSIEDFTLMNPFVSGADTLWLYKFFQKINHLDLHQRNHELRNLLVDNALDIMTIMEKIPSGELSNVSKNHALVLANTERIIKAAMDNFNEENIGEYLYDKKFINKLIKFGKKYDDLLMDKFGGVGPDDNSIAGDDLIVHLQSERTISKHIKNMCIKWDKIKESRPPLNKKQERRKKIHEEMVLFVGEIMPYFLNETTTPQKKQHMEKTLVEILTIANLYPAREIRPLLTKEEAGEHAQKFINNYNTWQEKLAIGKNKAKFEMANIILDNCHELHKLEKALKAYTQKLNKKGSTDVYLSATQKRKQFKAQMIEQSKTNAFDVMFHYDIKKYESGQKVDPDKMVAYLLIKADNCIEKPTKNTVNAFNRCYRVILSLGLQEDAMVIKTKQKLEQAMALRNKYALAA